jgi:predicted YcjX-like family ATPase
MIGRFEVNYQVTEGEHDLWQASANVLVPALRLGVVGLSMAGDPQTALAAATMKALLKIEDWPRE